MTAEIEKYEVKEYWAGSYDDRGEVPTSPGSGSLDRLTVYGTLEEAQAYFDSIDVKKRFMEGYNAGGRRGCDAYVAEIVLSAYDDNEDDDAGDIDPAAFIGEIRDIAKKYYGMSQLEANADVVRVVR